MERLLNNEFFDGEHIIEVHDEIESLYRVHNSMRSIIDMVKSDTVLNTFYELSKMEVYDDNQDHEPEIFIFRKTLKKLVNLYLL